MKLQLSFVHKVQLSPVCLSAFYFETSLHTITLDSLHWNKQPWPLSLKKHPQMNSTCSTLYKYRSRVANFYDMHIGMTSCCVKCAYHKSFSEPAREVDLLDIYYGLTVASPYVGMARKQDGGSNRCINVYMVISSLGNKCSHLKVHRAAYRACSSLQ